MINDPNDNNLEQQVPLSDIPADVPAPYADAATGGSLGSIGETAANLIEGVLDGLSDL